MVEGSEPKKAYFFDYMIHRLLVVALERRELDDHDHFGKKHLDPCSRIYSGRSSGRLSMPPEGMLERNPACRALTLFQCLETHKV